MRQRWAVSDNTDWGIDVLILQGTAFHEVHFVHDVVDTMRHGKEVIIKEAQGGVRALVVFD